MYKKLFLRVFAVMYKFSVWFINENMIAQLESVSNIRKRRKDTINWFSKKKIYVVALKTESNPMG